MIGVTGCGRDTTKSRSRRHRGGHDLAPSPRIIGHGSTRAGTTWSRVHKQYETRRALPGPSPTNNRSRRHQGGNDMVTTPQSIVHGGTKRSRPGSIPQIMCHGTTGRARRGHGSTKNRSLQLPRSHDVTTYRGWTKKIVVLAL